MMAYDSSDPKQVKERRKAARFTEQRRLSAFGDMLATRDGRAFFFDLLEFCGVFRSAFAMNALVMANTVGHQNVGLRLLSDLSRPELVDLYVQMLKEGAEKDATGERDPVNDPVGDTSRSIPAVEGD